MNRNILARALVALLRAATDVYRTAALIIDYIAAIIGSCVVTFIPPIRKAIDGSDPNAGSRLYAVYACYDRRSLIADYVVDQVAMLARLGYRVVFVATSPALPDEQAAKVARHCWRVLHRRNFGHDFGSYKDGIRQIDALQTAASLILMNDSCYGPLFDMAEVEQRARASHANLWGITDSWQSKYHVQSYFVRIDNHALGSRAFGSFWDTLLPYQSRELAVRNGEIRFTQSLLRNGMTTEVLCPYQAVASRVLQIILARVGDGAPGLLPSERTYLGSLADEISMGTTLNQMHSFWDVIIVEFGCPFIKRNLLRQNPARIPGIVEWAAVLAKHTRYDTDMIDRHLKIG